MRHLIQTFLKLIQVRSAIILRLTQQRAAGFFAFDGFAAVVVEPGTVENAL